MSIFNNKKSFFIIVLAVSAGLAIACAIMTISYAKTSQETYTRCIESSANILINDGNTPSDQILSIAKESCEDYKKSQADNPASILAYIAILVLIFGFCGTTFFEWND